MSVYIPAKNRKLTSPNPADKLNNQFVLTGANQMILDESSVVFLESFYVVSGQTITVADGQGNAAIPTIAGAHTFDQDQSPLRLDHGIIISGTIGYAKGFILHGVLQV
jgi:hypothetical protein